MQRIHHAFTRSSHDASSGVQGTLFAPKPANAVIGIRILGCKFNFEEIGKGAGYETFAFEHLNERIAIPAACLI
jgi:hypothetical protein